MEHSFNVDVAKECGVAAATILHNIYFWVDHNKKNERHFHDGTYWTYNSLKAFTAQFPYLTTSQVRTALDKLKDNGFILTGNYNEDRFNKTQWYAVTDKTKGIYEGGSSRQPEQRDTDREPAGGCVKNDTDVCENSHADEQNSARHLNIYNNIDLNNTDNKQQIINTDNKHTGMSNDILGSAGAQPIIDAWNSLPSPVPKIKMLIPGSPRYKSLKARIADCGGVDNFLAVVKSIENQPFLLGKVKEFVIDFDWLIGPRNFPKVAEGKYAARESSAEPPKTGRETAYEKQQRAFERIKAKYGVSK